MTDNKTVGAFIKSKRTEKQYSQKELAELLFVTEGAVSKWERGVSYPDITLISDICRVLDISEHELITASTDTEARKMKQEARKFRLIRSTWICVPTISYAAALVICFICNLAVNHTLSWFFVVLAALICAYTFVPTVTCFFESKKLLAFCVSTYLSVCLLLFTCAVYTGGSFWFLTACIGVLMGYVLVFVPILLSNSRYARHKFVISFGVTFVLTVLMLLQIRLWRPFETGRAILMTAYGFAPVILSAWIFTIRLDGFLKAGSCTAVIAVMGYFTNYVVACLFGPSGSNYSVDFRNWEQCMNGNIHAVTLAFLLLVSAVFVGTGVYRIRKNKNR